MGAVMETVDAALAAAAAGGFQAFGAGANQTFTVRGTGSGQAGYLIDHGAWLTTAAQVTVRSNRLHDATQGILSESRGAEADIVWPIGVQQPLYPQDTLTVGANFDAAPAANAIQHATLQMYYPNLDGGNASLRHWSEVQPNIIESMGVFVTPVSGASPGSWGNGVLINSKFDLMKGNQLYAVLGFVTTAVVSAVAIQGPDTSNFLCGGPNSVALDDTRWYFKRLSDATGLATIPVINSANKAGTNVLIASSVAATAADVTLHCVRLSA